MNLEAERELIATLRGIRNELERMNNLHAFELNNATPARNSMGDEYPYDYRRRLFAIMNRGGTQTLTPWMGKSRSGND